MLFITVHVQKNIFVDAADLAETVTNIYFVH